MIIIMIIIARYPVTDKLSETINENNRYTISYSYYNSTTIGGPSI